MMRVYMVHVIRFHDAPTFLRFLFAGGKMIARRTNSNKEEIPR